MNKMKEIVMNPKPMFYACILESLRKVAKENGYALAIHGSCAKDLDLIAVRWNDKCSTPYGLAMSLFTEISKGWYESFGKIGIKEFNGITRPERRYKNQIKFSIPIWDDWYIDLTVIDWME